MNDLEGLQKLWQDSADGIIDDHRSLAAADDQKYRFVSGETTEVKSFQPVSFEKLLTDRRTGQNGFAIRNVADGLRKVAADLGGRGNGKLVCQTGSQVRLVDHDRDMTMLRCHDNRNCHKAAFGKDHAGFQFFHQPDRLPVSFDNTEGIAEILNVKITAELSGCDAKIRNLQIFDELSLNTIIRTNILNIITFFLQLWNKGNVRGYMAGSTSAGKNDSFLVIPPKSSRNCSVRLPDTVFRIVTSIL